MELSTLPARHLHSHLFTVRVWEEELGGGTVEVRMQVRHVLSGETRHLRTWTELTAYMQAKIETLDTAGPDAAG